MQLAQQVRQALRLGLLQVGDQLPTAREVVAKLAINPNTVLKAYRELERERLVGARPGQGTFVLRSPPGPDSVTVSRFSRELGTWMLGIPLHQRVGRLSGGQRAQTALALALGKRPALLLLDRPVANLDPLARASSCRC